MTLFLDHTGATLVSKTGLGSSAALIASLVAACATFFHVLSLKSSYGQTLIHRLAQVCHCLAQGKIGSGFDIASALYGSCRYRRFSPVALTHITRMPNAHPHSYYSHTVAAASSSMTSADVVALMTHNDAWTETIEAFALPWGMHLMTGDRCGGSETVGMVKRVLAWVATSSSHSPLKDHPLGVTHETLSHSEEGPSMWQTLEKANETFQIALATLTQFATTWSQNDDTTQEKRYDRWLRLTSTVPWTQGVSSSDSMCETIEAGAELLLAVRSSFTALRACLKKMGEQAGVPIEPWSQTLLANATMALPGVLLAGVPGAGGEDAIFAIVLHESARQEVETLWEGWHVTHPDEPSVCPLLLSAAQAPVGLLVVDGDDGEAIAKD